MKKPGHVAGMVAAVALAAAQPADARGESASASAYRGLAAWVDLFDPGPWRRPERLVDRLAGRGVATVFVQTSNFRLPRAIQRPRALARMLAAAHGRGIDVIAWYLPGFADPGRDWRRTRAAVRFATADGHRFDGFALDIEATAVRSIALRNHRMLRLSSRLREDVGEEYALGAIVPDPVTQRYWPRFPWRAVGERFDVVLPMLYWTFHLSGEARAYGHARDALKRIRARTGDGALPVHAIGGIASHASGAEVRGFARAAVEHGAAGASLYDAPITRPGQWRRMAPVQRLGATAP